MNKMIVFYHGKHFVIMRTSSRLLNSHFIKVCRNKKRSQFIIFIFAITAHCSFCRFISIFLDLKIIKYSIIIDDCNFFFMFCHHKAWRSNPTNSLDFFINRMTTKPSDRSVWTFKSWHGDFTIICTIFFFQESNFFYVF